VKNNLITLMLILAIGITGMANVWLWNDINSIRHELAIADAVMTEAEEAVCDIKAQLIVINNAHDGLCRDVDLHAKQLRQSSDNERVLAENDEAILRVLEEMVRQLEQHRKALEKLMQPRGYKMAL